MLRSRSRRFPVPSAYQLAPCHLVYRSGDHLAQSSLEQAGAYIRQQLPERLRGDWDAVLRRRDAVHGCFESGLGEWLVEHGPRLGARPPTVAERSRALELEEYHDRLGLAPVAMYDAQGNSFDQAALAMRLAGLMQLLGAGQAVTGHGFAPPWIVAQLYEGVCEYCLAHGAVPERSPYPADLRAALRHTSGPAIVATLGFDAAPGGRRDQ